MAVVVSILESTVEAARAAADRVEPAADLLEFRLDALAQADVAPLLEGRRKATIVACPLEREGGRFRGAPAERLARLRAAAAAGASWVDIDWRAADSLGELPGRCRRIVSYHDAEGMPADPAAALGFLRPLAGEKDLVKFVPRVDRLEDALRLARCVVEGGGRLVGFGTGRAALLSRILAVAAGSPLVYAAPAPGRETAPGQPALADLRAALPPGGGGASTSIFAVVGRPVGHSLSPAVHTIALRMSHLDASFLAFEPDDFIEMLDLLQPLPFVRGLAVTAPFKEDALRRSDRADETAKGIVAANTLVRTPDGWRAANTDDDGAADAIETGLGGPLLGRTVLVIGTGGAARAVAAGVRRRGAKLVIAGRRPALAEKIAAHFGGRGIALDAVGGTEHDVLVNATPVGQWPGPEDSPVPAEAIRAGTLVVDAVVRPLETRLARLAKERGANFLPGVNWFLLQAARQFQLFTGSTPPLAAMRATALDALRRPPRPLLGIPAASDPGAAG